MLNIRSANRRVAFIKSRGMCGENHPLVIRNADGTCPICTYKGDDMSKMFIIKVDAKKISKKRIAYLIDCLEIQATVTFEEDTTSYKSAADEAMSYCLETTNDEHAKKLLLNALNIGAHGNHAQQSVQ